MKTVLSNSILSVIIKSDGAELISLTNIQNNTEYIWEGNPNFWGKQSPVLFPIVGTLNENVYEYEDKKYELSRHGFARDHNFSVIEQTQTSVTYSLQATDATKKVYPFEFELHLIYILEGNELIVEYKIINNDTKKIPFSIGAHPAFALPNSFEKYSLLFEHQETLTCFLLENDLLSDTTFEIELDHKKLPLNYATFENDALIFKKLQSKSITILEDNNPKLKIAFDDFQNLGIWTKHNAPFICIEPWLGYSDTVQASGKLIEKEGIQFVEVNESKSFQFQIEIL